MRSLPEVCVVYLIRGVDDDAEVLLGHKKAGLGAGRLVGPGGKLETGEAPVDAAIREVREETALHVAPADLDSRGSLTYLFPTHEAWSQRSHVFVCRRFEGEARESDELVPAWHPVDRVPLERMWDDARFWLPRVLAGGTVSRTFAFAADRASVQWDSESASEAVVPAVPASDSRPEARPEAGVDPAG